MSIADQIIIPVRKWLIAATGLPSAQVIPADDPGTRPALPYITVRVLTQDVPDGVPEEVRGLTAGGIITENVRAPMTGSLQLDAYGPGSAGLLAMASLGLALSSVKADLRAGNISVHATGGVNDLSSLVDDTIESRHQRDFYLGYSTEFEDDVIDGLTGMDQVEGGFDFSGDEFSVIAPGD